MSLKTRVRKAVLRRIEALPIVQAQMERAEHEKPVLGAAMNAAYSSLDDGEAARQLRERLDAESSAVQGVLTILASGRDRYIDDRAYRLLAAAFAGTAVESISPERAELFAEEEAIGRMPIGDAFERLAKIEPRLLDLERAAQTAKASNEPPEPRGLPKHIQQPLSWLVGAAAKSDVQLLHTSLATSIVHHYLEQLAGDPRLGTPATAYFNSPIKRVVLTGTLWEPTRPQRRA
jgi:hypothetical protein